MLRVKHATPLNLPIAFVDEDGNGFTPTAATWRLLDQDEVELTTGANADIQGELIVVIPAELNVADNGRQSRSLIVTFTTATGVVVVTTYYIVTPETTLKLLTNSFQTYGQALVLRESFGGMLEGWDASNQVEQTAALEHAFLKLAKLTYRVFPDDPQNYAGYEGDDCNASWSWLVTDISSMPVEKWAALQLRFRTALTRAQLIEADNLLGGDVVGKRRRDGILSETTGESSMMFNSRPALDLPVCRDAHREVSAFVYRRVGLTRG